MRKLRLAGIQLCLPVCLLLPLLCPAQSQVATGNSAAVPSDPKALMLLAARFNNLTDSTVKPWHMKSTYKLTDNHGATIDEGTFEEFWAGPNRFKLIYTGKSFTQTDYGTPQGVLRSGQHGEVSRLLVDMSHDLVNPLPNAQSLGIGSFTEKHMGFEGTDLLCLTLANPAGTPEYCIAADQLMLRITSSPVEGIEILHDNILRFQDRFIAGDLNVVRAGRTVLSAHLKSIEILDPVNDAVFSPPSEAVLLPRRVSISSGVAAGMQVHKVAPKYPPEARVDGTQGTVALWALIGTDGHIKDLSVISGPRVLQQAAVDAVHRWRYRPYLLNGSPVEVMTTINVTYLLRR